MSDPYSDAIDEVMEEARQKLCDLMAEIKRGELVREGDKQWEQPINVDSFEHMVGRPPTRDEHNLWLQITAGLDALFSDGARRALWWDTANSECGGYKPRSVMQGLTSFPKESVLRAVNRARGIG